ncbi:MAG: hypothetical protein ACM3PZ_00120 [Bacillota bacterium]
MKFESPLKQFRDMFKNPDLYNEGRPEKAEIDEMLKDDQEKTDDQEALVGEAKIEKHEIISSAGKNFIKTVEIIKDSSLKSEAAGDMRELKIFEERKKAILSMLKNIHEDIRNYIGSVNYMMTMRRSEEVDQQKFLDSQIESEESRRRYHNKLIGDIKIAARMVNITFNAEYPEERRLSEESQFKDREGLSQSDLAAALAEHEYYKFPYSAGAFIDFKAIPREPDAERKYIASWAMQLYSDMTALETSVKEAEAELRKAA